MIEKILKLDDGTKIKSVKGTITDVFEPRTGTSKQSGKDWKAQDINIKDDSGFLKCTIWGVTADTLDLDDIGKTLFAAGDDEGNFCPAVKVDKRTKKKGVSLMGLWRSKAISGETNEKLKAEAQKRRTERQMKRAQQNGGGGAIQFPFAVTGPHMDRCHKNAIRIVGNAQGSHDAVAAAIVAVGLFRGTMPEGLSSGGGEVKKASGPVDVSGGDEPKKAGPVDVSDDRPAEVVDAAASAEPEVVTSDVTAGEVEATQSGGGW